MDPYLFNLDSATGHLAITLNQDKFDASCVAAFKERLAETWSPSVTGVSIDFNQVGFIDSSGIGALLGIQKRLKASDEPVTILNARRSVIEVIELLRLHRVFRIKQAEE
ncbi:MAG: STAS domain-containing protein [Opitutales bacterium]